MKGVIPLKSPRVRVRKIKVQSRRNDDFHSALTHYILLLEMTMWYQQERWLDVEKGPLFPKKSREDRSIRKKKLVLSVIQASPPLLGSWWSSETDLTSLEGVKDCPSRPHPSIKGNSVQCISPTIGHKTQWVWKEICFSLNVESY